MTVALSGSEEGPAIPDLHPALSVALFGFAALYIPVYWGAANGIWQTEDHSHGAIILAVMLWLFWTLRRRIADSPKEPRPVLGWPIFALGLGIYLVGRVFDISILEFGSQPLVVGGALLLMAGMPAVRVAWFPLAYMLFMVPLPGILVDSITGPLKEWISDIVVRVLYSFDYPIARQGVIISIGQYQLLVADACSGLRSMFSLSALGTLFMYIVSRKSLAHNAIVLISILPIAIVANVARVIFLVLLTYHFGDEAGQGFLHGTAGIVLMLIAMLSFFALDAVLLKVLPSDSRKT